MSCMKEWRCTGELVLAQSVRPHLQVYVHIWICLHHRIWAYLSVSLSITHASPSASPPRYLHASGAGLLTQVVALFVSLLDAST
ncbi:hypothetical protein ARMGADRAFT_1087341 [Armillaria gallica]|uniref:Uncharacterized protein n=1 Tax=Armillaria gallica TaxID=47427 RepID=A0A2H3DB10_ARMGA|nr:hypothetical protein ARMGADRAFT_1087341 [Armillaria gallica]